MYTSTLNLTEFQNFFSFLTFRSIFDDELCLVKSSTLETIYVKSNTEIGWTLNSHRKVTVNVIKSELNHPSPLYTVVIISIIMSITIVSNIKFPIKMFAQNLINIGTILKWSYINNFNSIYTKYNRMMYKRYWTVKINLERSLM